MRRHRTTARATVVASLLAGILAAALTAPASGGERGAVPRLVFPLVAKTELWDNYGDPRGNGRHAAIDMENPWRAPVVAVEDGRIKYWDSGLGGCMLYHYGRSGTTYLYIHLNNDLTPRNDNKGGCVKDVTFAVPNGAKVTAGQQIAWNGDSGDASGNPHLHFEVHPNDGPDVNPFKHLKRATKPLFAARTGSTFSLGLRGKLLAGGAGAAMLEITRVRQYPGGRWLEIDPREVELTVPLGAEIAPALELVNGATLRTLKTPVSVAAFTLKAQHDARSDPRRTGRARSRPRRPDALARRPQPSARQQHEGREIEKARDDQQVAEPDHQRDVLDAAPDHGTEHVDAECARCVVRCGEPLREGEVGEEDGRERQSDGSDESREHRKGQ